MPTPAHHVADSRLTAVMQSFLAVGKTKKRSEMSNPPPVIPNKWIISNRRVHLTQEVPYYPSDHFQPTTGAQVGGHLC